MADVNQELIVIFVTTPDRAVADKLASSLLDERLIACANILPGIESIYRWQGKIERSSEHLLLLKTRAPHFAKLSDRIAALHPYDTPEIVAVPIANVAQKYRSWVIAETE